MTEMVNETNASERAEEAQRSQSAASNFSLNSLSSKNCIVAMLEGRKDRQTIVNNQLDQELEPGENADAKPPPGVVRCPVCKQDSNIGNDLRWVQLLTPDFVTMNLQDSNAMELFQLSCESCKTKDKAVARCIDCANFLCPNCVQAHQFMRCFESHKVC
ncbi:unnamed protein product [Soboliphyme baturini]|uniref:B box-type domain-containing protein n=1 Tax=Soboliphyme baturini TaxID=241478 RepID=A0A183ITX1_9BILA|nr:unnamed protein product [Soboliphyme baturini]